ncbi:MAG: pyrimidine/purine nucleoside phosphorylase [Betaproteobacteria bacterium]|jgi:uncharacterized protein YaiE (UPF0345 family)
MSQFDQVSVIKKANVFFDGKCISHTVLFVDGSKKSVGVIFPSTLTFNTAAAEVMEIMSGQCRVKVAGESNFREVKAGESFSIPSHSSFQIEVIELVDYVCHFQ